MDTENRPAGLLTSDEAARWLAISPRTLRSLRSSGKIPFISIGRLVRFSVADLEQFVSRSRQTAPEPQAANVKRIRGPRAVGASGLTIVPFTEMMAKRSK